MTFVPKASARSASLPMRHVVGLNETKGDVGIEIEVEGNKFPKHSYEGYDAIDPDRIPKQWVYHRDGSLRGVDNAEYVLKKPLKFTEVPKAINDLWKMFGDYGTVLDVSNRTSVHVHLNVQSFFLNRLTAFTAMYLSLEEILTAWCGDHRVGNLFCLRAKDAPAIVSEIKTFIQQNGKHKFSNGMHYAGYNVSSLHRFGSVEIRSLRGCTEPEEILTWVGILQRIYELSEAYTDPRGVIEGFSGGGPLQYLEDILGPHTNTVIQGCGMTQSEIVSSLYEGVRFAQDLCYCRDWNELENVDPGNDPFGRKFKKSSFETFMSASTVPTVSGSSPIFTVLGQIEEEYHEPPEPDYDDDFYDED